MFKVRRTLTLTHCLGLLLALLGVAWIPRVLAEAQPRASEPSFLQTHPLSGQEALATFAGGCFWCMEAPFEKLPGVRSVISGYTGGTLENPSYRQVCSGGTGHLEAIQVHFDATKISFEKLLDVFWRQIDPTDSGGQFVDRGSQYRPAIFFHDQAQSEAAIRSRSALEESQRFSRPITVELLPARVFYPAEDYHQDYYRTHSRHYHRYRVGSGRDRFLEKYWGKEVPNPKESKLPFVKPSPEELKKKLTALQFRVTQEEGTEPPFHNQYWDNKLPGIYVDVVSGEPLFSSREKYRSGTGWPSFFQPLEPENLTFSSDRHLGYTRTEVRSKLANSHLGHVFEDGPAPTGKRYCMNSAAMRFIPVEELEKEGLERYLGLFQDQALPPAGSRSQRE